MHIFEKQSYITLSVIGSSEDNWRKVSVPEETDD